MKYYERQSAIRLRKEGHALGYIAKHLSISKSTASLWTRDVELSELQKENLKGESFTSVAIEKRRESRLKSEEAKRQSVMELAKSQILAISDRELWLIGIMLYWAEGGKTQRMVRFSNGDPRMIEIMMKFFRQVCEVPERKFRGYIHIHPHLDHVEAEQYWAGITGISKDKFFKTYRKQNVSSKNYKDTLPYGVMDIYVHDAQLFLKIKGWAAAIFSASS